MNDIPNNMDGSKKYYAIWKKLDIKRYILYDSIILTF